MEILAAVQNKVEVYTGLRCFDVVPKDAVAPYYQVVFAGQLPEDHTTMYKEMYTIHLHAVEEGASESEPNFELVQNVSKAMAEHIMLPEGYEILSQTPIGAQPPFDETNGTTRSIIGYNISVFYGYKMKI